MDMNMRRGPTNLGRRLSEFQDAVMSLAAALAELEFLTEGPRADRAEDHSDWNKMQTHDASDLAKVLRA
jgi:hypothetical protein